MRPDPLAPLLAAFRRQDRGVEGDDGTQPLAMTCRACRGRIAAEGMTEKHGPCRAREQTRGLRDRHRLLDIEIERIGGTPVGATHAGPGERGNPMVAREL